MLKHCRTALFCASLSLALPVMATGRQDGAGGGGVAEISHGATVYRHRCAACHGKDLRHGEGAPDLVGPIFLQRWRTTTSREQIERIQMTMPQDDPGTLTWDEAAALRSFILAHNCPPSTPLMNPLCKAD